MARGRPKAALVLSPEQRAQLESMAGSRSLPAGLVTRVRIVLLSASGKTNQQIARQFELTNGTVGKVTAKGDTLSIKIDVDGLEHKVLAGCHATLRDPRLKTVLIEINSNLEEHRRLAEELTALGFAFSDEQVLAARRTDRLEVLRSDGQR